MKHDLKAFRKDVEYYKKLLLLHGHKRGDEALIIFGIEDEQAFYSIAPLSLAMHGLGMKVAAMDSKKESIDVLRLFWKLKTDLDDGIRIANGSVDPLKEFLDITGKRTKGEFQKITAPPKSIFASKKGIWYIITAEEFIEKNQGKRFAEAKTSWLKKNKKNQTLLDRTTTIIWKQVYNLKRSETAAIGFVLVEDKDIRKKPAEDYLDAYLIAYSMAKSASKICRKATLGSSSATKDMMDDPEKISDLSATLSGCELDKEVDEDVFKKFKKLSRMIGAERLKPADAVFAVNGEGYSGKHIFGQYIGYPTLNKKARWQTPGMIAYKLPWYPQTKDEERLPMSRIAITSTIPLDIFIETNNIDWFALEKRNRKIMAVIEKSDLIFVKGKKTKHGQTNFVVHILDAKTGKRRHPLSSGTDVREKIDQDFLSQGIVAGTYGNIPGGEAFMTPEYIKGTFLGDVVISIDRSYTIPKKSPLVITCDESGHKIISGDKRIIATIEKERNESLKQLGQMEKNGAVSKEIAKLKRENFYKVGEFAINTNPKARLCDYLIVNEKIANMMHIAIGSGFDADRSSTYHYDIVIDAKSQKMDVYGEKDGKKTWILRDGLFVI